MKKVIYERRRMRNQDGVVLLWSMLAISLLILVVSFLTVIVLLEINQSKQIDRSSQAYMAAEAGYERAINYARNEQTTGGTKVDQCTDSKVEGGTYTCNVRYTFEVVKSAAVNGPENSYDANPTRFCDNANNTDYCFYSEGASGDSLRKLDGTVDNVGPSQSEAVDFSTTDPVSLVKPIGKINLSPSGLGSVPPVPANRNFYFYRGKVSNLRQVNGGKAVFGLGFTTDGSTDYGIGAFLNTTDTGVRTLELRGVRVTGASPYLTLPANTNPSISLGSEDEVTFTLEYRRGASDISERTVSLQVNNVDKTCRGLITVSYTSLDPDYRTRSIDLLSTGVPYGFFNYGGTVSGFTDPEAPKRSKSSGSTDYDRLTVFDYDIPAGYLNSEIYFKDLLLQIYE